MATYPTPPTPLGSKVRRAKRAATTSSVGQRKRTGSEAMPKKSMPKGTKSLVFKGVKPKLASPTAIKKIRKTY